MCVCVPASEATASEVTEQKEAEKPAEGAAEGEGEKAEGEVSTRPIGASYAVK